MDLLIPGRSLDALMGATAPRVRREMSRIVVTSFEARGMRHLTQAEVKRRVEFCTRLAGELRRTLGWSPERIVDQLPAALKAFIDDTPWEPDTRDSWTSTDDTWAKDA